MDNNIPQKSPGMGPPNYHMPPPTGLPPLPRYNIPQSPHNIVQSPHIVASPHHVVQSPHHAVNSPATHTTGNYSEGNVFQFSDAHIGMAQQAEKENTLALSNMHSSSSNFEKSLQNNVQGVRGSHSSSGQNLSGQYQPTNNSVQSGDAMLSAINYNDNEMLHDSAFDVSGPSLNMDESLLASNNSGNNDSAFDLFDSENNYNMDNQQDMPLSPSCSFSLSDSSEPLSTLASVSTKQEPLGQNENSGSSHSSSVSSVSEKPSGGGKVGRPGRGRGSSSASGRHVAQCQICGKHFNNSSALAKHKLTHSDERKHICPVCSKAFKRQDHLNGHMMTHRSKKPFGCKFEGCDKSYCDARSLRRHLENHHQQTLSETGEILSHPPPFFQFDQQVIRSTPVYRQNSGDSSKSPGYQSQFSPISPAPGQAGWPSFSGLDSDPKFSQCTICNRRFKNLPALNGHMRLHGGYFRKDSGQETGEEDKKPIVSSGASLRKSTPPTVTSTSGNSVRQILQEKNIVSQKISPPTSVGVKLEDNSSSSLPNSSLPQQQHHSVQQQKPPPSRQQPRHSQSHLVIAPVSSSLARPTHEQQQQLMMAQSRALSQNNSAMMSSLNTELPLQRPPAYPQTGSIHSSHRSNNNHISQQNNALAAAHIAAAQEAFTTLHQPNPPSYQSHDISNMRSAYQNTSSHSSQSLGMSLLGQRRNNVPAPLDTITIGENLNALHSPGPGSHPATPSHPLTPSHPHTPSHAITAVGQNQVPSHPHTPAAVAPPHTPNLPYTPSLIQTQNSSMTPHTPHTPSHPCTPSHPVTPHNNTSSQHFQFPPPQDTVVEESYTDTSNYQSQAQQHASFEQQLQEQQQQLQQMHLQEQARQMELQLQQELEQFQEEQTIQQIKEELQSSERQLQSQENRQQSHQSHQSQLEEFMDTNNISLNPNKSYVVQHVKVNLDLGEFFRDRPLEKLEEFKRDRKRRASADPDKFTQPKRQFLSLMMDNKNNKCILDGLKGNVPLEGGGLIEEGKEELKEKRDLNDNTKTALTEVTFQRPKSPINSQLRHKSGEMTRTLNRFLTSAVENKSQYSYKPGEETPVNPYPKSVASSDTANEGFKNPVNSSSATNNTSEASPTKKIKRKHRPEPLVIPPHVNHFGFQSRLRSPRLWTPTGHKGTTPPPYTPPPMLSPLRKGSGLFCGMYSSGVPPTAYQNLPAQIYRPFTPLSAPVFPKPPVSRRSSSSGTSESVSDDPEEEQPPATDIQPHVNIGPQYQAVLPEYNENRADSQRSVSHESLLFTPQVIANLTEEEVQYYQDFACCAAIPGNGTNKEYALHLLYLCQGDIRQAVLKLMQRTLVCQKTDSVYGYKYQESDVWSCEEIEAYSQALLKCDKDFFQVAKQVGSKSVKQCIEFYYLWKKVCGEEYKRMRLLRRKREHNELYNLRSTANNNNETGSNKASPKPSPKSTKETGQPKEKLYSCQFAGCNSVFQSRQALNGHARVHSVKHMEKTASATNASVTTGKAGSREASPRPKAIRDTPSPARPASNKSAMSDEPEDFPCRVCGKVFYKVKSRNAHMKSHRTVEDKQGQSSH